MEILSLIHTETILSLNQRIDMSKIKNDTNLYKHPNKNNNYKKSCLISINPLNPLKSTHTSKQKIKLIVLLIPSKKVQKNFNNLDKKNGNLLIL